MKKRILSMLLVLALVLTMIPDERAGRNNKTTITFSSCRAAAENVR